MQLAQNANPPLEPSRAQVAEARPPTAAQTLAAPPGEPRHRRRCLAAWHHRCWPKIDHEELGDGFGRGAGWGSPTISIFWCRRRNSWGVVPLLLATAYLVFGLACETRRVNPGPGAGGGGGG
jgi:hypothetical protein